MDRVWTCVMALLPAGEDPSNWHDIFVSHGIESTEERENPVAILGYYAPEEAPRVADLRAALEKKGAEVWTSEVPESDWANVWRDFFKPWRIGRRFVVRPTWEEFDSGPDDIELVLDPGQAFGTGNHATTRMCLCLLEDNPPTGQTIADIGCGTGILGIAALKLGATSVVGVDTEPEAVHATLENAERNGVTMPCHLGAGFAPLGEATYDTVLSNILSASLIALAPTMATRVRPGGTWIVSGIIRDNWPDVEAAVKRAGFTVEDRREEGEWVAARLSR